MENNNKKLVFLVEKDAEVANVYNLAFKDSGFDIETVALGNGALSKIKNIESGKDKKPDIILLNAILPDVDGTEILKELKSREATKDIPVFMLSYYSLAESGLPEMDI